MRSSTQQIGVAEARVRYFQWIAASRDLSRHTVRAYESDVIELERHVGGDTPIGSLDASVLIGFLEALRESGLAATSVRRRAAGVRGFCDWMAASGLLDADPWPGALPVGTRSRRLPRVVPAHELHRLLAFLRAAAGFDGPPGERKVAARPHESTTLLAVTLMLATGMRVRR